MLKLAAAFGAFFVGLDCLVFYFNPNPEFGFLFRHNWINLITAIIWFLLSIRFLIWGTEDE